MDVFYRRTASSKDKKYEVAAEMSVDTKFFDAAGSLDVSSSRTEKRDKTTVTVNYKGAGKADGMIAGLNM